MEHTYGTSHLRARAAQLMTWLLGPAQNQQRQMMENDRQTRDGITRGADDPDTRRQGMSLATPSVYDARADKREMRATVQTFADDAAQQRLALHAGLVERGHAPEMDSGYRPRPTLQGTSDTPSRTADLSARAEALLQRLERQQEAQQQALEQSEQQLRFQAQHRARQGGRKQGMGW